MTSDPGPRRLNGSFRDPDGFMFVRDGVLYRQVNTSYREGYDTLMAGGLYAELTGAGLMVEHVEEDPAAAAGPGAYKVIRPEYIPFISYPYEWCFSQLQDAALLTLRIQKTALEHGMTLKDASAYNVQFRGAQPVFCDTLSFAPYEQGKPWAAYRQFCQHFLAPLALMAYCDARLHELARLHIDGAPLDLACTLLPGKARLNPALLLHLFSHAASQKKHAQAEARPESAMKKVALLGLIDSLETAVKKIRLPQRATTWSDYYDTFSYSEEARKSKETIVREMLAELSPDTVWDLGANTGRFSQLAAEQGAYVTSFDMDSACVEMNYCEARKSRGLRILPLIMDLANPSPGLGWAGLERVSLVDRGPAHTCLALALVHHLAIANNVPLPHVAAFLATVCRNLIVEFIPKPDKQVQRMLSFREDIFSDYTKEAFHAAFDPFFKTNKSVDVADSQRSIHLMSRRESS